MSLDPDLREQNAEESWQKLSLGMARGQGERWGSGRGSSILRLNTGCSPEAWEEFAAGWESDPISILEFVL